MFCCTLVAVFRIVRVWMQGQAGLWQAVTQAIHCPWIATAPSFAPLARWTPILPFERSFTRTEPSLPA